MTYIKKPCLAFVFAIFIFCAAGEARGTEISSPDCHSAVFIDPVYTQFFKSFVWINQKSFPERLREDLFYWAEFQHVLTQQYGYLPKPPAELILRNQLCYHLGKRNLRQTNSDDHELIAWFKKNGVTIVAQIKSESQKLHESLIVHKKTRTEERKIEEAMNEHMAAIRNRIMRTHFKSAQTE